MSLAPSMEDIYVSLKQDLEKNKYFSNPKLVICFSGVSGSGKTTIARKLEKDLNAVRLCNDDIRIVIEKQNVDGGNRRFILEQFLDYFRPIFFSWCNGAIIVDSGIDRVYLKFKEDFKGYSFFVISLDAPKKVLIDRILGREGYYLSGTSSLATLDKWTEDRNRFLDKFGYEVDIFIDTTEVINYEALLQKIRTKMLKISEVKTTQS